MEKQENRKDKAEERTHSSSRSWGVQDRQAGARMTPGATVGGSNFILKVMMGSL